jgi:DNA (cytosine-5)-methyltransferase 1
MESPKVIDLFSGCGGMSWGLEQVGFNIIAGIDNWKRALETFKLNHPHSKIIESSIEALNPLSVRENLHLNRGELDCLIGGPPCQGFSKNVPSSYRFLEDSRNQLFKDFLKYVEVFYPKVVFMENVAEIYNAFSGSIREEIVDTLEKWGYKVEVVVVFAPDYGVPQRRRRCFFFASRTGIKPVFPISSFNASSKKALFEEIQPYRSAWSTISDLPLLKNGEGYEPMPYDQEPHNSFQSALRNGTPYLYNHVTRNLNSKQYERIASIGPGEGLKELPVHMQPKSGYSGAYGRLDFEMVAPTITRWVFHPGSGRFCHPREPRLLTIREAARLQTFTDDFRFTGTYIEQSHQVGNAVPPLLMTTFAEDIRKCLAD